VLAAELARLETDPDDEFFASGGPLDFEQSPLIGTTTREPHRPVGRKLAVGVAGLLVLAIVGLLLANKVFSGGASNASGTRAAPATHPGRDLRRQAAPSR